MKVVTKRDYRKRRQLRQRKKISGTAECPRLSVFVSLKHMYVQLIDDVSACTLGSVTTQDADLVDGSNNVEKAAKMGAMVAAVAKEKGVEKAVFDRSGYRYGGRVKAIAEGAREAGLKM